MRPVIKSEPITPEILFNLLRTTPNNPLCPLETITTNTLKALCLLYFTSMLRSSNLIPVSLSDVDPLRLVCWGNIRRLTCGDKRGVVIEVSLSKTIQYGQRKQFVTLAPSSNPLLCPVQALNTLAAQFGVSNCGPDTPIFQIPNNSGKFVPITRAKFNNWFRLRLTQMGVDASLYTLHSFRHGGIQQTLLSESNYALCRLSSDHSSDAIMEYSQIPPNRRLTISDKVNRSLADLALTI